MNGRSRAIGGLLVGVVLMLAGRSALAQCVSLTGAAYTQNFDTLSNTAGSTTNSLTIPGWFMTETGGGARDNEQYAVDTGASSTGDTYSYGTAAATDRALGAMRSGTLIPLFGVCFTNNTGTTLSNLAVAYTGEEWRNSTAARTDQINFEYSTNATDLNTGAWTGVGALNFITPFTTAPAGAKDGNAATNRTFLSATISSLSIANGATFWIRWTDTDATGADDGLAVDDFSLTPSVPSTTLSINDVSHAEGNAGTTTYTFTVSLSAPAPGGGVSFDVATADGTAVAPGDYTAKSLTGQTIPAGMSSYTFDVLVNGDIDPETSETFFVNVTNVTGATVSDSQGQGTITNDDTAPNLSINDVILSEGDSATTTFTFTVSLSSPAPSGGVTFDIATANDTAGTPVDYTARSLTGQTIPAGMSSYTFDVAVNGDTTYESGESFYVNVTGVTGATLVDGQGLGGILNDDPAPTLSINDVTLAEGTLSTTTFSFTVTLSAPAPPGGVTFDIATADDTALSASDYTARSLTGQTIPAGMSSYTFDVGVTGDATFEPAETFFVNVTNATNATLGDGQGLGTINNDDAMPPPALSVGDVTLAEGNASTTMFTFAVSLSTPAPVGGVTFDIATADDTAVAPGDYTARALTAQTIPAGMSSYTFDVGVDGDNVHESTETFFVNVTNVTNATVSDAQGLGTISNDDALPAISVSDVILSEGNSATTAFAFTVSLSSPAPAGGVTFDIATADGTGVAPGDYTSQSLTAQTIAAGLSSYTFTVLVNGDGTFETGETFFVNVSSPTNATIADGQGQGTITNDDAVPALSINDLTLAEGDSGSTSFAFTVSLSSPAPTGGVTFDVATADDTAVAPGDYIAQSLTSQTIPAGMSSYTFTVAVNGDNVRESDETFLVNLSAPGNATIGDGQGLGTITNDDPPPVLSINDVTLAEGNSGTTDFAFTVSLSAPAPAGGVTFDIATADNTATATGDYAAQSLTTQTIPAGLSAYAFIVVVNADSLFEPGETFYVNVGNVMNATIGDGQGLGTIANDDVPCVDGVTCVAGNYCAPSEACLPQRTTGLACNPALDCKTPGSCSECLSGNCVDGFCCDAACSGTCSACSAARKGGGADGACGPIARGTDPDNECVQDTTQSCGQDGTCDGAGACARYGTAVTCDAPVCMGGDSHPRRCDGLGACVTSSSSAACAPLVCSSMSGTCLVTCSRDTDCVAADYCETSTGHCLPRLAAGLACQLGNQCGSGFCVDGVCCTAACTGTCVACSAARKAQGPDGVCAAIAAGHDPDDECPAESQQACGRTGLCDGAAACAFWPNGTDCAATPGGNVCVANRAAGTVCSAPGVCSAAPTGTECAPQRCVSGACAACTTAADCTAPATHFCDSAGVCQPRKAQGAGCGTAGECTSGSCVDGLCCDTTCTGACEWCADPANPGVCQVAAAGAPRLGRTCSPGDAGMTSGDTCALACNGQVRDACVYPPAGTACAAGRCASDALVATSTCDGTGACVAPDPQECGRYTCDGETTSCRTVCLQSSDCKTGSVCDLPNHACVAPRPDAGIVADAAPATDAAGDAPAMVDAGADFAADSAAVVDAPAARPDAVVPRDGLARDGGDAGSEMPPATACTCRVAGRPVGSPGGALVVLLAVGAALLRRRRSDGRALTGSRRCDDRPRG